jgi:hypothetical protein
MQDAEPNGPKAGWTPTASTAAGGGIGLTLGEFIVAFCDQYLSHPLSAALASATTGLCIILAGYFFPDGGRK